MTPDMGTCSRVACTQQARYRAVALKSNEDRRNIIILAVVDKDVDILGA